MTRKLLIKIYTITSVRISRVVPEEETHFIQSILSYAAANITNKHEQSPNELLALELHCG